MSFSSEIKEELSRQISNARHCRIAELAAIISMCGRIKISSDNKYKVYIHTENITVARKYYSLLKKLYDLDVHVSVRRKPNRTTVLYSVVVSDSVISYKILQAVKLINRDGDISENLSVVKNSIVQNSCCKRAFLRGAFLTSGSMSDPDKTYHFEIATATMEKATQIKDIIKAFYIDAKIVPRKKQFIVYIKEGSQIVDILNVMEAHVSLMNFENLRIIKEMRNVVNRQVNCETANIAKTVNAATRQIEDIMYIKNTVGFGELSDGLRNIAELRIEHPEMSLKDLGMKLNEPLGKSGVNHRLRKLSIIAESLRTERSKEEI
ncbi:MAG: DNA-binding protein WhiA [Lachnospiraceae bacterium]|nr:DNA-binding protein WhiA [Lachnospiraceae bacterium]